MLTLVQMLHKYLFNEKMITVWLQTRDECAIHASRGILVLLALLIIIVNEHIDYEFILVYMPGSHEFCQHVSVSLKTTDSRILLVKHKEGMAPPR